MANRSAETPYKEKDFGAIIRAHVAVTPAILRKNPWAHPAYLYVDVTAGPGMYEDGLCGSPVIFLQEANQQGVRYQAWMIERDAETARLLTEALSAIASPCGTHRVYRADHNDQARCVAAEIARLRGKPFGLVYADMDNLMLPLPAMKALAVGYMDLLVYLSATNHKRVSSVHGHPPLMDQLQSLGKRHIWLREPRNFSQSTFALLSNWAFLPTGLEHDRMVRVGTPDGDRLAERLNISDRARKEAASPRLPFWEDLPIAATASTSPIRDSEPSEVT